jgi:hypothetical protein
VSPWTDEEILALVRLWPTQSTMQIANTLHRSHSAIRRKATELRSEGLLESKNAPRVRSIKPDPRDFDDVKRDYCRKLRIDIAELDARLERDDQLAAKLYRQAQAAKPTRLRSRPVGRLGTGSSPLSAPFANGALTRQRRS